MDRTGRQTDSPADKMEALAEKMNSSSPSGKLITACECAEAGERCVCEREMS